VVCQTNSTLFAYPLLLKSVSIALDKAVSLDKMQANQ